MFKIYNISIKNTLDNLKNAILIVNKIFVLWEPWDA